MNDHDLLVRIDERLKSMDEKLDKHLGDDELVHEDHEKRIRLGERIRNIAIGVTVFGGSGWGWMEWWK
jgi:hypothetical protein